MKTKMPNHCSLTFDGAIPINVCCFADGAQTCHVFEDEWCGNCIHCKHSTRGYYCTLHGDADDALFLTNQKYEAGMEACADWESVEEANCEAELDALLADIAEK